MKKLLVLLIFPLALFFSCTTSKKGKDSGEKITKKMGSKEEGIEEYPDLEGESPVIGEYTIQKEDTLMWISYLIYGDYRKWRSIHELNYGVDINNLQVGEVLSYYMPNTPFMLTKVGKAHKIKKGDTLGKISFRYFKTTKKWKDLWRHNLTMIINPNKIYAGFTLYIPDIAEAEETLALD